MLSSMPCVTVFQWHLVNLLYNVSGCYLKSSVTSEVLITAEKHLLKIIVKSISEFQEVVKN